MNASDLPSSLSIEVDRMTQRDVIGVTPAQVVQHDRLSARVAEQAVPNIAKIISAPQWPLSA